MRIKTLSLIGLASIVMHASAGLPQDASFRRSQLAYGISIEVPSHWTVLSIDARKNLAAAGHAMTNSASIDGSQAQRESLLAMNATPNPTGAMIRVSVSSPPDYTQSDLASTTVADLQKLGVEMLRMFEQMEASGGPKIMELQPVRIEKIGDSRVLVMPYIRAGIDGASPWQVTQYKIPLSVDLHPILTRL